VTEIRSYRRVFDLERRIYSVDRLRLNPGGVPVRGVVYFLVLLLCSLAAGALPGVGSALAEVSWYVRDLAAPAALASVLTVVRVEGRSFHLAARALAGHLAAPRTVGCLRGRSEVGARWFPDDIVMLPDGSDAKLRRLRYSGPGAVLVAVEHEHLAPVPWELPALGCLSTRRAVVVAGGGNGGATRRGQVILLEAGARLLVRSAGA
jgi:hypothetical protein